MPMYRVSLRPRNSARPRGFVLVTMALTAAGIIGVAGLAVDVGRIFVIRNELQVYSDAAALAASQALDGTSAGMARAVAAALANGNRWNFGTTDVSNAAVAFGTTSTGPWVPSPANPAAYSFAKVTASASVPLYFLPCITGQSSFTVSTVAVAAQIAVPALTRGVSPYTAVSTNTTGPAFGFVAGNSYSIHWPTFNGNRSKCDQDPLKCFNSDPCADDPPASLLAVVNNWGSNFHGYWGDNSNAAIAAAVLDGTQIAPLSIGDNIDPLLSSGDKQSEAGYLDQRANQDTDTLDGTPATYLASTSHNGRRLLPVAVVDPVDPSHTNVIGFGVFLLLTNGTPSNYYKKNTNGNSPYCALYVGPYHIGSAGAGTGSATGATTSQIVQ